MFDKYGRLATVEVKAGDYVVVNKAVYSAREAAALFTYMLVDAPNTPQGHRGHTFLAKFVGNASGFKIGKLYPVTCQYAPNGRGGLTVYRVVCNGVVVPFDWRVFWGNFTSPQEVDNSDLPLYS